MIKKLKQWIANPKRSYAEGVEIFEAVSSKKQKLDYLDFFRTGLSLPSVSQFDIHFTTLVNQLAFAQRSIQRNPEKFKDIAVSKPAKDAKPQDKATALQSEALEELPEEFAQDILRLKEIVPIMARVHAEMSISDIAPDKRAGLRNELIELDKERRAIWERIDKYNIDGEIEKTDEELQLEENLLLEGANIAKRIAQLRSNITRNTNSVKDFTKKGDKKKAAAAQARLDEYKRELSELEILLDEQ